MTNIYSQHSILLHIQKGCGCFSMLAGCCFSGGAIQCKQREEQGSIHFSQHHQFTASTFFLLSYNTQGQTWTFKLFYIQKKRMLSGSTASFTNEIMNTEL